MVVALRATMHHREASPMARAISVIPAKRGGAEWRTQGIRAQTNRVIILFPSVGNAADRVESV
jgi:hypothetical protein